MKFLSTPPFQGWAYSGFDDNNPNADTIFSEKQPQIVVNHNFSDHNLYYIAGQFYLGSAHKKCCFRLLMTLSPNIND